MFHKVYIIILILCSPSAFACSAPMTGGNYDSLVQVKLDKDIDSKYLVSAPEQIDAAKFSTAIVHILKSEKSASLEIPLEMKFSKGYFVGEFYLHEQQDFDVIVSVWWVSMEEFGCPIIGQAKLKKKR